MFIWLQAQNRFKVPLGTKFYRVKAKRWDREAALMRESSSVMPSSSLQADPSKTATKWHHKHHIDTLFNIIINILSLLYKFPCLKLTGRWDFVSKNVTNKHVMCKSRFQGPSFIFFSHISITNLRSDRQFHSNV